MSTPGGAGAAGGAADGAADGAEIRKWAVQIAASGSVVTLVLGAFVDGGESGVGLVWIIGLAGSLVAGVLLYGIGWMVELFGPGAGTGAGAGRPPSSPDR